MTMDGVAPTDDLEAFSYIYSSILREIDSVCIKENYFQRFSSSVTSQKQSFFILLIILYLFHIIKSIGEEV